ncbi:hypothetical protein HDU83_000592 [Entophlyctis luteolus]|nr:hypothetical protein HDU83_000592 [Entophlyctis luteolus]
MSKTISEATLALLHALQARPTRDTSQPLEPPHPSSLPFQQPRHEQQEQQEQQPLAPVSVPSRADLTVALLHALLVVLGFRISPDTLTQSSQHSQLENDGGRLPDGWNTVPETYSLAYRHERSALAFVVKAVVMADRLLVHCTATEDGSIYSATFILSEIFARDAQFPVMLTPPPSAADGVVTEDENPLLPLFAAGANGVENVLHVFKTTVVDRVAPNLNKEGYEPVRTAGGVSSTSRENDGVRPVPPRISPVFRGAPAPQPIGGNFGIGDVDLDPFAAAPGIIPPRFGMHPGGGMVVGPDHPIFSGGRDGGAFYGGPGGAVLPPGAVPPNARFDPIGPFGPRPPAAGSGFRGGGGGFGGIGNPFGDGGYGGHGFPRGSGGRGGRGQSGRFGDDMPPPGFDNDDMYL